MKKTIKALKKISILLLLIVAFIACDKDFSSIESAIQGSENFNTDSKKFPIVAYNKKINAVQTNNLSVNALGVYNGDIYGLTTASVVSQIVPNIFNPNFGTDPEFVSAILTIPYFSTNEGPGEDDGSTEYSLNQSDSLFGDAPIKLSIYQNNYFLRDIDPENAEEPQRYYSNSNSTIDFDSHVGELLYQDDFIPSNEEIVILELDEDGEPVLDDNDDPIVIERIAPSLRVPLLNPGDDFWANLLFFDDMDPETVHPELSNQNNFKDYFRGLYFKAESIDNDGNLILLNFNAASIVVNYSYKSTEEATEDERLESSIRFGFAGNRLNIFENDPSNTLIENADAMANTTEGDENLYLKGGQGAMAIVDLFEGEIFDEETGSNVPAFDYFMSKNEQWLINEANLVFYVNQALVGDDYKQEPDRVMLYDLKNSLPIIDYFIDGSTNSIDPLISKINHSSILERDEANDNAGVKYKIKLTEHINNIFSGDSTNVKLGLVVSTNVNEIAQSYILDGEDEIVTKIPSGAVMSPKGTILYGSNESVDEEVRVQLEIFYTEPEN